MTLEVNAVIDQVRISRGLEPLPDPHHIEGFGPGSAPPPPADPDPNYENPYPPIAYPAPEPVVYTATSGGEPIVLNAAPAAEAPELAVWGASATYKGHTAELTAKEQAAVGKLIFKAVRRNLKDQMKAVTQTRAKRKPKIAAVSPEAPKRKRGRPRKVVDAAPAEA